MKLYVYIFALWDVLGCYERLGDELFDEQALRVIIVPASSREAADQKLEKKAESEVLCRKLYQLLRGEAIDNNGDPTEGAGVIEVRELELEVMLAFSLENPNLRVV